MCQTQSLQQLSHQLPQMTSAGASPLTGQHLSHEISPHAESSSRRAMQIGDFPPETTFPPRNVVRDDVNRLSPIQPTPQETEQPRVTVNSPPQLPSGTRRAIENIVQAHMERLHINAQAQQARKGVWESTAGSVPIPGLKIPNFSFPIFQRVSHLQHQLNRSCHRPVAT